MACATSRAAYQREWRRRNPDFLERHAANERAKRAEIREAVLTAFGRVCGRCGFQDTRVLQVHHVAGDGEAHRSQFYTTVATSERTGRPSVRTSAYYRDIIRLREAGSDSVALLCANCHIVAELELQGATE